MGKRRRKAGHVPLPPRHARLVYLLQMHLRQSRSLPPDLRGWVSREQLAKEVEALTDYRIGNRVVGTYLSYIVSEIERVTGTAIQLFEYRKKLGVRLTVDLKIVDGTVERIHRLYPDSLVFPTGLDSAAFLIVSA